MAVSPASDPPSPPPSARRQLWPTHTADPRSDRPEPATPPRVAGASGLLALQCRGEGLCAHWGGGGGWEEYSSQAPPSHSDGPFKLARGRA